jgi:hypothetical protein
MYKVGDKITKKDGTVKTITLFDQLAALGGSDLKRASSNQIGDIKQWNKLDRFVHGFIVCTRMLKEKSGKKLLKECNIKINNLTMEQILEDHKLVNNL